jgi:hypothetical protein
LRWLVSVKKELDVSVAFLLSENSCIFSVGFAVVPRLERSWGSINRCGFAEIWVCVFVVFCATTATSDYSVEGGDGYI